MKKLVLLFLVLMSFGCIGPARTVSLPMTVISKEEYTTQQQTKTCSIQFQWEHSDGWGERYVKTPYEERYCSYNVGDNIK